MQVSTNFLTSPKVLLLFQVFFPIFSGKYGKYPLIVLRANAGGVGFSRVDSGSENAYSFSRTGTPSSGVWPD